MPTENIRKTGLSEQEKEILETKNVVLWQDQILDQISKQMTSVWEELRDLRVNWMTGFRIGRILRLPSRIAHHSLKGHGTERARKQNACLLLIGIHRIVDCM